MMQSLVGDLTAEFEERSADAVDRAARAIFEVLANDGVVHVGGSGHSLAMVCEAFYRAGGLACVSPIYHPQVFPLLGAVNSSTSERTLGLGAEAYRAAGLRQYDLLVVFSTSGSNPYPVELAQCARRDGVEVVGVTSPDAAMSAARRSTATLAEAASIVVDTCVPRGDVTFPEGAPETAASSTIMAGYAWNRILMRIDVLGRENNWSVPRWVSANVPGGDERNAALLERYSERIPALMAQPLVS